MNCDSMWEICQADDPFVCFGAKSNKGLGLEISNETGSGGEGGPREARGELAKEPREGHLMQRGSWERAAEGTSQDELAVLDWQRSAEGSREGRPVKMSWHS